MSKMKAMWLLLSALTTLLLIAFQARAQQVSDREKDGLSGQVASILSEYTFVDEKEGKYVESRRYYIQTTVYNINGRKTFETPLEACDACSVVKTMHDKSGKIIEESFYNPVTNILSLRVVYSYDSFGKRLGEDHYDASGNLYRKWQYTYEYDPQGNWIKKTASMSDLKFFNGKEGFVPRQIYYRTIAYH